VKKYLSLFLLLLSFLFSEEVYKIKSKNLSFDNKFLNLENDFVLENDLGTIKAKKAKIENFNKNKLKLTLTDDVILESINNTKLLAKEAILDLESSNITFLSDDKITFFSTLDTKKIKNKNFYIEAKQARSNLNIEHYLNKPNIKDIYSITFTDNIFAKIDEDLTINSSIAKFFQEKENSFLFLYPKENEKCLTSYKNSYILSNNVKIDLIDNNITFENASGEILDFLKNSNKITFSSSQMLFNNFENSILLKDNVVLKDENKKIFSNEVEIIKKIKNKNLHKMITRGNTIIEFLNKKTNKTSTLTSTGTLELDNDKRLISAFSNKKKLNENLIFQDEMVMLTSKKAFLSYSNDDVITEILLKDNVKFTYKKDKNTIGYGIADSIKYNPKTKILKLSSNENKRVLFWQDDDAIHLSANEIIIDQNEKESIKALGDVRCTFNLDEEKFFNEIFSEYMWSYE
jgi:lipopolysaccharide export system protein LptA